MTSFFNGRAAGRSVSSKTSQILTNGSHRRSTGRHGGWRKELTPFVTCGQLRGAKCLSGFCAATGEMDESPSHRERRESVALRGAEQLVKRCIRRAPAKADHYAEGGIEDAAALHIERKLGGNPISRHALLTSCGASTDARHRHGPNHCHDSCASSLAARPSHTSRCICDRLGTEPCRRRSTSWPAGGYRITSSAIAGRRSTYAPAVRRCGCCGRLVVGVLVVGHVVLHGVHRLSLSRSRSRPAHPRGL